MKKQVVVIGGGDTFKTHEEYLNFLRNYAVDIERYKTNKDDWKPRLRQELGEDYEVIIPIMPNKTNARFEEWKLWFEKIIPFLNGGVILVGHSMGGSFLVKYLSENKFPKKILGVFIVSAVYDKDNDGYGLVSFYLPEKLDLQTKNIYFYHSKDDPVVPFSAIEKFRKYFPNASFTFLDDRGHINQKEFPELVKDIKNIK